MVQKIKYLYFLKLIKGNNLKKTNIIGTISQIEIN